MGRSSDRQSADDTRGTRGAQGAQGVRNLEFRLPDLGEGLTEAEIVHWLVDVGDSVAVDQPVVEVETAKALVEVPCPYGGVVTARFGAEGTELPVGAPLLTVAVGQATQETEDAPSAAEEQARPARPSGQGGDAGRDERAVETGPGARVGSSLADRRGAERRGPRAAAAHEGSGRVLVGYGTTGAQARRRRVRPPSGGGSWPTPGVHGSGDKGTSSGEEYGTGNGDGALVAEHGGFTGSVAGAGTRRAAGPVPVLAPMD